MEVIIEKSRLIINQAEGLYTKYCDKLLGDEHFRKLMENYSQNIRATCSLMQQFGIWGKCTECGKSPQGSCCAPEVATWYDPETILLNLVMGCSLPNFPVYPNHCLFLGKNGCILKSHHYYCVHFLCTPLKSTLSPDNLACLYSTIGSEILVGSVLFHYLHRIITKAHF